MKQASLNIVKTNSDTLNLMSSTINDSSSSISTLRSEEVIPPSYSDAHEFVKQECQNITYKTILSDDKSRWFDHPYQIKDLENNDKAFYFNMKPYYKVELNPYSASSKDEWYFSNAPIYRHNFECNLILVTLRYYPEETVYTIDNYGTILNVQKYLNNTNSIKIFKNGRRLNKTEFLEISDTEIQFEQEVSQSDIINIQYGTATLIEDNHYHTLNANIIKFHNSDIFDNFSVTDMTVWGMRPNKEALNPIKLIDKKAKVVVKNVPYWHPLDGYHFTEPYKNIDIASVDVRPKLFFHAPVTNNVGNVEESFIEVEGEYEFELTKFNYVIGNLDLFLNGVKVLDASYTQNSPTTFTLLKPIESNDDILEATTWYPITKVKQTFYDILNHHSVVDGQKFTTRIASDHMNDMSVFLNGIKLFEFEYTQTSPTTFELTDPIISDDSIVEVSALISPDTQCPTYTIQRHFQYYANVKNLNSFKINNFTAKIGEMTIYLNGFKLPSADFTQTDENSFTLTEPVTSNKDIIEVNVWNVLDISALCKYSSPEVEQKIDVILNYNRVDQHLNFDTRNLNQDLQDPAVYSYTPILDQSNKGFQPWSQERIGTVWLDTKYFHYKRYHDIKCFPDCVDRMKLWGEISDFGEIVVYEWVESEYSPEEYDAISAKSEKDIILLDEQKKTGQVRSTLFESDGEGWWKIFDQTYERFDAAIEGNPFYINEHLNTCDETSALAEFSGMTFATNFSNAIDGRSLINVYVNGIIRMENIIIPDNKVIHVPNAKIHDRVYIVRTPTTDEKVLKELLDAGVLLKSYQYTSKEQYDEVSAKKKVYYFWVRNKTTIPNVKEKSMSILAVENELANASTSYFHLSNVLPPRSFQYNQDMINLPWRMNRIMFRGLKGSINADRRYTLRFTKDFTLRDNLDHGIHPIELKNLHEEWKLFRKEQNYIIDKDLWNKITESIIGRKIKNKNVPVPSYERQIYDMNYETETRFGLKEGETFTDGKLAKESILDYLKDRNNDFYPFKVDDFFKRHSFGDDEEVIESMDTIYSLVPYNHVNNMFFSVLHDALSMKHEYPDIIKTSWVSLHSIILLNDQGRFDD